MQTTWMTVIGITSDMKRYSLTSAPVPEMIVAYTQRPYPTFATMQFVVRSVVAPPELAGPIRAAIAGVDPAVPVAKARGIDDLIRDASSSARFAATTISGFGLSALLLAMIGLYGVITYTVQQRRHEFAIRSALGATRRDIIRLVLVDGLSLTVVGVVLGVGVALATDRTLHSMLYNVSPADPLTFTATGIALAAVACLASAIPAVRAGGVQPRAALEEG